MKECEFCGYRLDGCAADRCPECGCFVDSAIDESIWIGFVRKRWILLLAALCLLMAINARRQILTAEVIHRADVQLYDNLVQLGASQPGCPPPWRLPRTRTLLPFIGFVIIAPVVPLLMWRFRTVPRVRRTSAHRWAGFMIVALGILTLFGWVT
jgi:hypothetical protein